MRIKLCCVDGQFAFDVENESQYVKSLYQAYLKLDTKHPLNCYIQYIDPKFEKEWYAVPDLLIYGSLWGGREQIQAQWERISSYFDELKALSGVLHEKNTSSEIIQIVPNFKKDKKNILFIVK